jgi:hypothetical protein
MTVQCGDKSVRQRKVFEVVESKADKCCCNECCRQLSAVLYIDVKEEIGQHIQDKRRMSFNITASEMSISDIIGVRMA